jgi:hypothetical protein
MEIHHKPSSKRIARSCSIATPLEPMITDLRKGNTINKIKNYRKTDNVGGKKMSEKSHLQSGWLSTAALQRPSSPRWGSCRRPSGRRGPAPPTPGTTPRSRCRHPGFAAGARRSPLSPWLVCGTGLYRWSGYLFLADPKPLKP